MNKFYGTIGYEYQTENPVGSGVWTPTKTERQYCGDIIRNTRRLENGSKINDDININNQFSILADPYAYDNIYAMKYITWINVKWKIVDVEVKYPRLILTIGGEYND